MEFNPHLDKLKANFSSLNISPLGDYGCNIYLDKKVVTIYWGKKKRYGFSTGEWFDYYTFDDVIQIIKDLTKPKETILLPEINDNGTQQCIDHIKRKIEFMKKGNANPNTLMMFNTLVDELMQYL